VPDDWARADLPRSVLIQAPGEAMAPRDCLGLDFFQLMLG